MPLAIFVGKCSSVNKMDKKDLAMTALILTTDCMVQYHTFLEKEPNIMWQLNICAMIENLV